MSGHARRQGSPSEPVSVPQRRPSMPAPVAEVPPQGLLGKRAGGQPHDHSGKQRPVGSSPRR